MKLVSTYRPILSDVTDCRTEDAVTHSCVSSLISESCFRSSLTHRKPPLFCQQGYLKQQGVPHNSQLWQHVHDAGLMPTEQDGGTSGADPAFPNYLAQAGASMSSGLKLDLWLFYLRVLKLCLWYCLGPSDLLPPAPIFIPSTRPNIFDRSVPTLLASLLQNPHHQLQISTTWIFQPKSDSPCFILIMLGPEEVHYSSNSLEKNLKNKYHFVCFLSW